MAGDDVDHQGAIDAVVLSAGGCLEGGGADPVDVTEPAGAAFVEQSAGIRAEERALGARESDAVCDLGYGVSGVGLGEAQPGVAVHTS